MATSKMKIKKVCEWCGTTFYAQKLTTRFCSHRCNNLAYKEAVRQKKIQEVETKVQAVISEQPISDFKDKEYLSLITPVLYAFCFPFYLLYFPMQKCRNIFPST